MSARPPQSSVLFDNPGPRAAARHRQYAVATVVVVVLVLAFVVAQLWRKGAITPSQFSDYGDPEILRGLLQALLGTLRAAAFAIVLSLVFGGILCVGRLSQRAWLRGPATLILEFFRAVPLLLLILALFLGFGQELGPWGALVLGLMLYNGSVLAEVFRAGIASVPRGQGEAAYALGLRKTQVMRLVLVPQAVRTMLPAIISQCVVALKDTSLGFIIGYAELARFNKLVYTSANNIIASTLVVTAIYVAMNFGLSRLAVWIEAQQRRTPRSAAEPMSESENLQLEGVPDQRT